MLCGVMLLLLCIYIDLFIYYSDFQTYFGSASTVLFISATNFMTMQTCIHIYIYIYIKCIVTNKYASRVLEYNNTNSQKICT